MESSSAGGIVVNKLGQILVVNQRGTSWSLPKGHIENGEEALVTAKREIYEESGIRDLAYITTLGKYKRYRIGKDGQDDLSDLKNIEIFLFKTKEMVLKPIDPHSPEAVWLDKTAVAGRLTHIKDKEFFLSVIDRIDGGDII